jgi:hypothetical protein
MHVILRLEIAVAVPVELAAAGIGAVEELHETHATLDEAAGEDAVLGEGGLVGVLRVVGSIELQDVRGLGAQIVDLGHAELHARGEFVAGDACGELLIAWVGLQMACVHLLQQRPRGLIGLRRNAGGGEMPHGAFGTHRGALKRGGEKAGPPVVRAVLRHAAWIGNGDVGGQILVLAAERICHPRAELGKPSST